MLMCFAREKNYVCDDGTDASQAKQMIRAACLELLKTNPTLPTAASKLRNETKKSLVENHPTKKHFWFDVISTFMYWMNELQWMK